MISRNEVKYIQSLYHKKNRDEEDVFVAAGVKLISEILHSYFKPVKIYALQDWIDQNPEVENVIAVNESELKKISTQETPGKVVAIVRKKNTEKITDLSGKITLLLDGVQDPGNLGTIIRTAEWFGIENIIATNDTADVYNPKVIQSTMGSFLRINIFYTDLKQFLSNNIIPVYGAVLNGENISAVEPPDECLLLTGNESKGIRDELLPYIQTKITIPRLGKAESLNVAVATGIILWKFCVR
jgi:TrmH family RNA methyltransferase